MKQPIFPGMENMENMENACLYLIMADKPNVIFHGGIIQSHDSRCKHQIVNAKINFSVPCPPLTLKKNHLEVQSQNHDNIRHCFTR